MSRNWETENGGQTAAFPRVGILSLPEQPLGEKGQGVATISLPFGVLLVLVDGTSRDLTTRLNAERTAVQAIRRVSQNARLNPEDVRSASDLLRQAIQAANGDLHQAQRGLSESGESSASCVLVLVTRGRSYVGHVGNARAYLVRNNAPNRLTGDHTTAQTWIDHGIMTEEQARERPEAHSLARALGEKARVEPDVRSLPLHMEKGDVVLLCSAGVHRYLEDDAMGSMVARLEPEHACHELCEVASTRSKNRDCKTLVYQSGPLRPGNFPRLLQQRRLRRQRKFMGAGAVVALLAALLIGGYHLFGPSPSSPPRTAPAETPDIRLLPPAAMVADVVAPELVADVVAETVAEVVVMQDVGSAAELELDSATTGLAEVESAGDVVTVAVTDVVAAFAQPEVVMVVVEEEPVPAPDVIAQPAVDPKLPILPTAPEPIWAPPSDAADYRRCGGQDLERGDRRRSQDICQLVQKGLEFLSGTRKDASAAARQARAASKTLRSSSKVVRDRCAGYVNELNNAVKARYLHLAWVSSTRAIDHLDQKSIHCAKSFRMARDVQRFGATDEEIKEARRICAKE